MSEMVSFYDAAINAHKSYGLTNDYYIYTN
jgi:hypothetical protein